MSPEHRGARRWECLLLAISVTACGRTALSRQAPEPPSLIKPQGDGWQLRDVAPYARSGHVLVIDETRDRMIVHGGPANDTWALALSGPDEGRWVQLVTKGHPPVHDPVGGHVAANSAVYDPVGKRLIMLLNPTLPGLPPTRTQVWQLALSGEPAWSELLTLGEPGAEVQYGHAAYDETRHQVLVIGSSPQLGAVWALSLGESPSWSRVAGGPLDESFALDRTAFFDRAQDRLILLGGHRVARKTWALSLQTRDWTLLDARNANTAGHGRVAVLDESSMKVVTFGGPRSEVLSFSLSTSTWTASPSGPETIDLSMGVVDSRRRRVLSFGGTSNQTLALSLDTLVWSVVSAETATLDSHFGERQMVFDSARGVALAYGGHHGAKTLTHGLGPGDRWMERPEWGESSPVSFGMGIYDQAGRAVISFGGYRNTERDEVWRLAEGSTEKWERLEVESGPGRRSLHLAVEDARRRRMLIFGGCRNCNTASTELFANVWALTLNAPPRWEQLPISGAGPSPRAGALGVYDPVDDRMIVIGAHEPEAAANEIWALSLSGNVWSPLVATGAGPGSLGAFSGWGQQHSAVYDPGGRRIVVVVLLRTGARVFALELEGSPRWREFCWTSLTPGGTGGLPRSASSVVLEPEGLFLSVSGGSFRFDLSTPYCD